MLFLSQPTLGKNISNVEFIIPDVGDAAEVLFSLFLPLSQGTARVLITKFQLFVWFKT
jgi:hypothetical protein